MATERERILKAEHDALLARARAAANQATIDYIAMMSDIDIPTEEEADDAQPEI